jgi:hypothetical protein
VPPSPPRRCWLSSSPSPSSSSGRPRAMRCSSRWDVGYSSCIAAQPAGAMGWKWVKRCRHGARGRARRRPWSLPVWSRASSSREAKAARAAW